MKTNAGAQSSVEKRSLRSSSTRLAEGDLDKVAGCLRSKRKAATLAEMRNAIEREVSRRHDRGRYKRLTTY
jgi:hypothetical protein